MKKHAFDPLSFFAGTIFLMIAVASVIDTDIDIRLSEWLLPASALVLGVGLLVASLRGVRRGRDGADSEAEAEAEAEEDGARITDDGPELVHDPVE